MTLLAARALRVVDRRGHPLVKGVDLEVERGAVTCLVGPSGAGKSLTLLAVADLLPPGLSCTGTLRLEGREVPTGAARRRLLGPQVGLVLQEPARSLHPAMPVAAQVGEGLSIHSGLRGAALRERVLAALAREGLHPPERIAELYPHQLSGGMRQRVLLAGVLALEPALLLLDEPAASLDSIRTADLVSRLREEVGARGLGVLLVTHDLKLIESVADQVLFMDRGVILARGPAAEFLADPGHPRAVAFLGGEGEW